MSDYMMPERFMCDECGHDTRAMDELYMVHHKLWEAMADGAHMLCVGCLEGRMGRSLNPDDFLPCPLNSGMAPQSLRLRRALGGAA